MRYKVAIRFAIDSDVRFISHHDTMRMFERALLRAELPVRFSEGFNPRPRLSLPLPRAVGIATDVDLLVVDLTEEMDTGELLTRLARQMPGGVTLKDAHPVEGRGTLQPESVTYVLDLAAELAEMVSARLREIMAAQQWPVERRSKEGKSGKTIDLRTWLREAAVDGCTLRWTALVAQDGTAKPVEVLTAVGLEPHRWHHHLRRVAVEWRGEPAAPVCRPTPNAPGE